MLFSYSFVSSASHKSANPRHINISEALRGSPKCIFSYRSWDMGLIEGKILEVI